MFFAHRTFPRAAAARPAVRTEQTRCPPQLRGPRAGRANRPSDALSSPGPGSGACQVFLVWTRSSDLLPLVAWTLEDFRSVIFENWGLADVSSWRASPGAGLSPVAPTGLRVCPGTGGVMVDPWMKVASIRFLPDTLLSPLVIRQYVDCKYPLPQPTFSFSTYLLIAVWTHGF